MIIMISAANADVCLSMARILKSHPFYKDAHLIGLTPDDGWPARHYFDEIATVPMANNPDYRAALSKVITDKKPNIFIPFSEAELSWFVKNADAASQLNTITILNPPKVLNTFLDKQKTADFLKDAGLPVPVTTHPDQVKRLPVIMKLRHGAGSKSMAIIYNQRQLEGFYEEHGVNLGNYVAQELIDTPDAEFTCGVWRFNNDLRYCIFRRKLQGGMTGFAKLEQHDAIAQALEKVAASLHGDLFINVQLRLRDEIPYIFEINPRFSSTVMMRHKIGFEDFIWTLDSCMGRPVDAYKQPQEGIMIFRVSDECVVGTQGEMA
jgi:carbamoyl-phosphate synthase large subunit